MQRDDKEFEDLDQDHQPATTTTPKDDSSEPVRRFASLPVFVEEYVLPNWVHKIGADYGGIWCSMWWSHPEAVTRLEALWEAFEVMRLQPPPSLSTWLRDHFDPHMHALTTGHGVFFACDVDRKVHATSPEWPATPAPEGMFNTPAGNRSDRRHRQRRGQAARRGKGMSDEEFEVGHELDRAFRAAVTGLAQAVERSARTSTDRARAGAGEARQEWLANRDLSRQQYLPWLKPGAVEQADRLSASKVWATAAAWSSMDPIARSAEEQLANRIQHSFGEHPSVLVQQTDPSALPPQPAAKSLLTMAEAVDLAAEHAPYYYRAHIGVEPSADMPTTAAEETVHSDWQHYSESGTLPKQSLQEAWAQHAGHGDEIEEDRWRTAAGEVDQESRNAALAQIWEEGKQERATREVEEHQVAMAAAGMGELRSQVAAPNVPTWRTLMDEEAFARATPAEITQSWRDARARAASGDMVAKAAASQLGDMTRRKYGMNPDEYLLDAMTERAATNAESRRTAEDRARTAEEARPLPVTHTPAPSPTTAAATAAVGEQVSRDRVLELNRQAQAYFADNLRPGTDGHTYLTQRLGEGAVQGSWAVGYAPGGWTNLTRHLQRHGATDEEILAAGLGRMSSRGNVIDAFRARAMVGIRDRDGDLVGFVGRDLSGDDRAPKYVNTGATPAFTKSEEVFGLHEAPSTARLVRTEGAFDAMAVSLASDGEAAGVAPMGTAMSETQAAAIAEKSDGRVWLANDRDDAGIQATEHDYYTLARQGVSPRSLAVPGDDPAAAWQENPGLMKAAMSGLDAAPSAGETIIDHYIDTHADALRTDTPAARRGLDDVLREVTAAGDDPIEARLLAVQAEQRRQKLLQRSDRAETEEAQLIDHEHQLSDSSDHTTDPGQAEHLDRAAEHTSQKAGEQQQAAGDLEDAAAASPAPLSAPAYDRATESRLENAPNDARRARVVSSHGYAMSTDDAISRTVAGTKATPARPNRGVEPQNRGKSRRR